MRQRIGMMFSGHLDVNAIDNIQVMWLFNKCTPEGTEVADVKRHTGKCDAFVRSSTFIITLE